MGPRILLPPCPAFFKILFSVKVHLYCVKSCSIDLTDCAPSYNVFDPNAQDGSVLMIGLMDISITIGPAQIDQRDPEREVNHLIELMGNRNNVLTTAKLCNVILLGSQ